LNLELTCLFQKFACSAIRDSQRRRSAVFFFSVVSHIKLLQWNSPMGGRNVCDPQLQVRRVGVLRSNSTCMRGHFFLQFVHRPTSHTARCSTTSRTTPCCAADLTAALFAVSVVECSASPKPNTDTCCLPTCSKGGGGGLEFGSKPDSLSPSEGLLRASLGLRNLGLLLSGDDLMRTEGQPTCTLHSSLD